MGSAMELGCCGGQKLTLIRMMTRVEAPKSFHQETLNS